MIEKIFDGQKEKIENEIEVARGVTGLYDITSYKKIIDSTPDYQNLEMDCSKYESLIENKSGKIITSLIWNDFVDSAREFYDYLKINPILTKKYGRDLVKIVEGEYSDNLIPESRKNFVLLLKKIATLDALNSNVQESNYELPDYFHGTGSGALGGIYQDGKLFSEKNLEEKGLKLNSGEQYLGRKNYPHSFVSFTKQPSRAMDTHAYIDGVVKISDFPVVLGFNKDKLENGRDLDKVYTYHADIEPEEVCVRDEVSMGVATHLFVPDKYIDSVKNFSMKFNLQTYPIEDLQKKSGLKFGIFKFGK